MLRHLKRPLIIGGVSFVLAISACHEEGPAEKAGKGIDQAMETAGDTMKKAGKSVGEKVDEAGEKMKDAAGK